MQQKRSFMERESAITAAICTLGCRVNQYESRAIAELLEKNGIMIRDFSELCDFYIINTCAVTAESERKSRQMCRRAVKINPNAKVIVTGCQAQLHPEDAARLPSVVYVCGNGRKLDAARSLLRIINGESLTLTNNLEISDEYENYSVKLPDHTRAYIKIEDGCENRCAYCVIPKVRGPIRSKPFDDVMAEAKMLVESGFKEIVLTGIETCSYQYGLTDLMREMSNIPGLERIRLSSVNPAFIGKKFTDAIADLGKICPHFHISLQSFCDRTLNSMRRRYNTRMIKENCAYLREKLPNVCFTADIICGFPGETDEDFRETLENTRELSLLHAHIFPYSKRPGTEAATMPNQVDESIKAERCAELSSACEKSRANIANGFFEKNQIFSLLAETYSNGYLHGHTENFVPMKLRGLECEIGSIINVRLLSPEESGGEFESDRV